MKNEKRKMKRIVASMLPALMFTMANAANVTIYVSPNGNDSADGSLTSPLASFARAQQLARQASSLDDVTVIFADGVYYLPQTIEFTPMDSKHSVVYRAENEGGAVISGGSALQGLEWEEYKDGIYMAHIDGDYTIDQLYIDGIRQRMARFPNPKTGKNVFDVRDLSETSYNSSMDALLSSRISKWENPKGGYIHAMHEYLWGDMHWIITGKSSSTSLTYEGGWQNNRPSSMHGTFRFVENIFEELDVEGEWYYNASEHMLYYKPQVGTELSKVKVEIVRLETLVSVKGASEDPVKDITFSGFVFRHAARTFMDNKEPLLRSDWTISRTGAVAFEGAENCNVVDCEFDQVGGNTVLINKYNRHITIKGCYIHDSGASGVVFVGDVNSVRVPMFDNGDRPDYDNMNKEKGPKTNEYPDSCLVEDCIITHTGRDEKQTAGVQISMSHGITIRHCSIYDVPRAGINISEGTFGGHVVEWCDIFNTVLETGDHGSFNSWGRDRFWSNDINYTTPYTIKYPDLPYLDILDPNELRYTRWRCDHGWDIDLDDGSSLYNIHHNVMLNGGLKLREGYGRKAFNNVIINNSLNPHVWFSNCGDQFYSNIITTAYKPANMTAGMAGDAKWGDIIDYNLFAANDNERMAFSANGCDVHSISGYPQFIDSVNGDYRVRETSPAIALGFENFPMDQFGVQKPSLKAIAKTPAIPSFNIDISNASKPAETTYEWMGVELKDPMPQELSAYGLRFDIGGVLMTSVSDTTMAAQYGFRQW